MNKDLTTAFLAPSFPVNPIPFVNGLLEGIKEFGMPWIQSDEAKAILHILNSQAYGQLYNLDAMEEFVRLKKSLTAIS